MKMYVGNCTQQLQDFVYRVPEQTSPRRQTIGIGEQILVSGDLSQRDLDYILEQHGKYGLIRVDEIDRTRPFIGMCWSDKPIPDKRMMYAIEHNADVLVDRGRTIRTEAALAVSSYAENQHAQSGLPGSIRQVETQAVEQATAKNPNPTFAEGVRVSRAADPPRGGRGRRRAA
jgi:hypothetical protein